MEWIEKVLGGINFVIIAGAILLFLLIEGVLFYAKVTGHPSMKKDQEGSQKEEDSTAE